MGWEGAILVGAKGFLVVDSGIAEDVLCESDSHMVGILYRAFEVKFGVLWRGKESCGKVEGL